MTENPELAIAIDAHDRPGMLAALARVIYEHGANVSYVGLVERSGGMARIIFELESVGDQGGLLGAIEALEGVNEVSTEPTFQKVFGKRIIVIGAGAQVSSVVSGAVSEADRHNIRGERISVDTIPLVGSTRLPRRSEPPPGYHGSRRWCSPAA